MPLNEQNYTFSWHYMRRELTAFPRKMILVTRLVSEDSTYWNDVTGQIQYQQTLSICKGA
jgi:hypothetical protein